MATREISGEIFPAVIALNSSGGDISGGGGGGGGAVTVADGADVALGSTTATAAGADGTGNYSLLQAAKRGLLNWAALLARIPALSNGLVPVDVLSVPGVARQLAAGSATANTALTSTCRRISIVARGADIRYMIGSSSQTANASTSHWIGQGERLDIDVPATPNIAVIRAATVDGTLEMTELL